MCCLAWVGDLTRPDPIPSHMVGLGGEEGCPGPAIRCGWIVGGVMMVKGNEEVWVGRIRRGERILYSKKEEHLGDSVEM